MDHIFRANNRGAPVNIHKALAVQVHGHDGQFQFNGDIQLPTNEAIQVACVLPDQNDDLLGRSETVTKAALNSRFAGAVRQFGTQVMSVVEVEVDGRERLPSLHPAVCTDISVTVEDD